MAFTFSGGLDLQKPTRASFGRITVLPTPRYINIDFSGDKNTVFTPFLSPGDDVCRYQCVGERTAGDDTVPVYSGVSGKIGKINTDQDGKPTGITVLADKKQRKAAIKGYEGTLSELTPEIIIELVKNAAVPCRGAYGFVYKKIAASTGKARTFILNFCESEPEVTSRKSYIAANVDEVLDGAKLIMRALDMRRCDIAIEKGSRHFLDILSEKTKKNTLFGIKKTKQKYPQDDELPLIFAITGVRLSDAAAPELSGCVVFDAEAAAAVYRAVVYGIPYCERVVTVEGANLLCPVGTPAADLLEFCDVRVENAVKIISGGPLRGRSVKKLSDPITPDTDALTVIYYGEGGPIPEMSVCNRCGRCVNVCPAKIVPYRIAELSKDKKYSQCRKYGIQACFECGCCDYVCPAYIPIKKLIRAAKSKRPAPKRVKNEDKDKKPV